MADDQWRAQVRRAAQVIFAAIALWLLGSWIGGQMGLPVKYAFLLDLSCLAALVWALVVLLRAWSARNEEN
jgi:Family of unknown function (DUF5337)